MTHKRRTIPAIAAPTPLHYSSRPAIVTLFALGVRIELNISGSDADKLAPMIREAWHRCVAAHDGGADLTLSVGGADADVTGVSPEALLDNLAMRINREVSRHRAGKLLMIHAATLADPTTGRVAVLAGPSGAGKTTLCTVLGREFGYVSDEIAGITNDGRLVTYEKPLSIVEHGTVWRKSSISPTHLQLQPVPSQLTLGVVMLLDRSDDGPLVPETESLPTIDAIAALAPHTFQLGALSDPLHKLAAALKVTNGARHVRYREARTLLPLLRRLMS
jgi:hypothetical protein